MNRVRRALLALACVAGVLAALAGGAAPPLAADEIDAVALAQALRSGQPGWVLLDTRGDAADDGVPGALALADVDAARVPPAARVVLIADAAVDAATLAAARRRLGKVLLLRLHGGLRAWNAEVLYPVLRSDASARERAAFAARAALSRYFGGTPRQIDAGSTLAASRSRRGC